jgi:hypothetical protein
MLDLNRWAYGFTCELRIETILAAFNAEGPWQWRLHDSVIFGDYLSCRPAEHVWLRVHELAQMGQGPSPLFATEQIRAAAGRRDKGFAASLQIGAGCNVGQAEVDLVFRGLLQGINATSITEIEPYD